MANRDRTSKPIIESMFCVPIGLCEKIYDKNNNELMKFKIPNEDIENMNPCEFFEVPYNPDKIWRNTGDNTISCKLNADKKFMVSQLTGTEENSEPTYSTRMMSGEDLANLIFERSKGLTDEQIYFVHDGSKVPEIRPNTIYWNIYTALEMNNPGKSPEYISAATICVLLNRAEAKDIKKINAHTKDLCRKAKSRTLIEQKEHKTIPEPICWKKDESKPKIRHDFSL